MIHQPRITYDGMEWPLETFLDAYGFSRVPEGQVNEYGALPGEGERVMAVLENGELVEAAFAEDLPWREVIAVRGLHLDRAMVCDWCGAFDLATHETGNGLVCSDCLEAC